MWKKIIAPAVIVVIFSLFVIPPFAAVVMGDMPFWLKAATAVPLAAIEGAAIAVFIQRIKEIRKEENEDDLSNY